MSGKTCTTLTQRKRRQGGHVKGKKDTNPNFKDRSMNRMKAGV